MTDPNKLTLLTPGFDRAHRRLCRARHPGAGRGAIPAREPRRAGEERPQFAALPADAGRRIEQGRHAAQRARGLQAAARRQCAARRGHAGIRPPPAEALSAACGCATSAREMHAFHREAGISALQRAQFAPEHLPEMVDAAARGGARSSTRNKVDYCRSSEAEGRIATTLMLVYPPGIGTIVPGERLGDAGQADARLSQDVRARAPTCSRASRPRSRASTARSSPDGTDPLLHLRDARGWPIDDRGSRRPADDRARCRAEHRHPPVDRRATCRPCWRSTAIISRSGVGDLGGYEAEPLDAEDLKRRRKNMRKQAPAASRRRRRRRGGGLCLCGAVPQAPGLSLHAQALDLRASRPSARGHRPAAAAGADRGLRGGRLSPDDRLYRRRQRGLAAAARSLRLRARRAACRRSASSSAIGPTA